MFKEGFFVEISQNSAGTRFDKMRYILVVMVSLNFTAI
jgi:hypothetical protein